MLARLRGVAALLFLVPLSAQAGFSCADVLAALSNVLVDATCFASTDLTTNNAQTTPADNSMPGLPTGAFTPRTDRTVIAPSASKRDPITTAVPGLQIQARMKQDELSQARFLLRLPQNWNGRLVVAGASGTRSEFNGDFAWSDFVVQQGYAYASQNKGVYNLRFSNAADPLACRLNPDLAFYVHFYDNDAGQVFTRWMDFMIRAGRIAQSGVAAAYGSAPRYTYAVGTSNGGYQVRRAIEKAPDVFSGGVDWEGTFVDEHAPNLLTDLPAAVLNYPDYRKPTVGNFSANSTAAKNIGAAGYPPDIVNSTSPVVTFWNNHWNSFWEVTQCQWQKRLDPGYDTYGSGTGTYNYVSRLSYSDVGAQMAAFATSGKIQRPLVTVAGTMDALLPIDHHARAYARAVADAAEVSAKHGGGAPTYSLYEIQNGNHIETYQDTFPQLELIYPHAHRAFNVLVDHVERGSTLPPSQCVPRGGGTISDTPAQPGHCTTLFVP
jgi:hypothetical protein